MTRPWWQREVTIAWALILFAPLGLFLMWKYAPWRLRFKWGWSAVFALIWVIVITSAVSPHNKDTSVSAKAPHATNTPKPTKTAKPTESPKPTNTPKGLAKTQTAVANINGAATTTSATGTPTVLVIDTRTVGSPTSGEADGGDEAVGTPVGTGPNAGVTCGKERWPVKTLSDQDADNVNFTPQPITVSALRGVRAPASKPQSARVAPVELTTYFVVANVVEFKSENDMDIHVVISDLDDPSQTMIVEFPDASRCSGATGSAEAAQMKAARAALTARYGPPPSGSFERLTGTASFVGVGFFDFLHGQTGVAPNGIELHPVIGFSVLTDAPPAVEPQSAQPSTTAPVQPEPTLVPPAGNNCDPAYPDACLADGIGDWDCAGGGGNGPNYIKGPIRVLPPDPFRLDGNGDGIAC